MCGTAEGRKCVPILLNWQLRHNGTHSFATLVTCVGRTDYIKHQLKTDLAQRQWRSYCSTQGNPGVSLEKIQQMAEFRL